MMGFRLVWVEDFAGARSSDRFRGELYKLAILSSSKAQFTVDTSEKFSLDIPLK